MDSYSDGWNVWNCSSSHVQVFRDQWNVQIGDGWNKCTRLVEYEFFEIGWNVSMNTPEFALSQL